MTTSDPEQVVTTNASASSATTSFVTTAAIPVGRVIVIATGRSALSTTTNGHDSIATSAGAVSSFRKLACACRSSTHDVAASAVQVTTLIPAGSTITVTHSDASTKRGGVLSVWPNVTLPPVEDATSGNAADDGLGSVSAGPNGSSATQSASTSGAMPAGDHLILGFHSQGGTTETTEGAGFTLVGKDKTTSGSGDRGVLVQYANSSASAVKTSTASIPSGGWAAAIATLPLTSGVTPPVRSVIVGGVKKTVTSVSVIVGGVKKPVTAISVIQGGAKKATV